MLRVVVAVALVAALTGAVAFRLLAPGPSPEQAITRAILKAEEDAERRSVTGVTRTLSDNYQDGAGYTRRDITRMIAAGLRAEEWDFSVEVASLDVTGDIARSVLRIGMWPAGAMSAKIDYTVTLAWRREGCAWRITGSEGWQGWLEGQAADAVMGESPPGSTRAAPGSPGRQVEPAPSGP